MKMHSAIVVLKEGPNILQIARFLMFTQLFVVEFRSELKVADEDSARVARDNTPSNGTNTIKTFAFVRTVQKHIDKNTIISFNSTDKKFMVFRNTEKNCA